ncbi:hypothetical protein OOK29_09730 [Streptomyces phaeochromogenes]|uniref:hypothetical protein n=1 Tax=Streptomyces phaeochromogenes TaxID=1923 RepID=UPI00224E0581|nr:hypothetical protein [Streptomyces phaeochromogenes]MCX5598417.1 hypothetical protein [Streptomyces phaeochromogenes]
MTDAHDEVNRGSGKVIADYVTRLLADVDAGRMSPAAARGYAEAATKYASERVKKYATAAINERLGQQA